MYGAAPFFAAGMTAATIASYQPFFKVDRSIHAMADQVSQNRLTPAVVLVADDRGVAVYPATLAVRITGDMLSYWEAGSYTCTYSESVVPSRFGVGLASLAIRPPGRSDLIVLEAKCVPIGVNRFNRRVARRVAELAKPT
jgi:hypothetical protein